MLISHTVSFVKALMRSAIPQGGIAIDATVGNGHDTLFLAECVGPAGHVYGFDIQQDALASARQRLENEDVLSQVSLFLTGHEHMAEHVPEKEHGHVCAAMFNLGYLPGSDQTVITRAETSCRAVDAALGLMKKGGIISMVLYTGHPGGEEEARAVEDHCQSLPMDYARVLRCAMHNHPTAQTRILLVEKR